MFYFLEHLENKLNAVYAAVKPNADHLVVGQVDKEHVHHPSLKNHWGIFRPSKYLRVPKTELCGSEHEQE